MDKHSFGLTGYAQMLLNSLESHPSPFVFIRKDGRPDVGGIKKIRMRFNFNNVGGNKFGTKV